MTGAPAIAIVTALAVPFLLAALLLLPARAPLRRAAEPFVHWAALPALACALLPGLRDATVELPWLLLGVQLGLTDLTHAFLVPTAAIWLAAGHHARGYLADDPARRRFEAFFLVTLLGNLGLVFARDVATFYLSFAVMTFAAYGLVVHAGDTAARRAGRVYVVVAVLGEAALLAGLLLVAHAADDLAIARLPAAVSASPARDVIVALLWLGFGVKAGALLLHVWLPLAHPVAPTPASAVLSGAMIKAGLLGWLQFLPLGAASLPGWGAVFVALGLGAAFYGVAVGLAQRDAKTVLAYSSISQMGLMTAVVGAALADETRAAAAMAIAAFFALHHGLAKSALFLGVAARDDSRVPPALLLAGLVLPALALAGAPATGGAVAKDALTALEVTSVAGLPAALLYASSFATTLLLVHFVALVRRPPADAARHALSWRCTAAWLGSVAAALVLPWLLALPGASRALAPAALAKAAWPVALGVAAWAAWTLFRVRSDTRQLRSLRIPAGDVLAAVVPLGPPLARVLRSAGTRPWSLLAAAWECVLQAWLERRAGASYGAARLEARLRRAGALVGLVLLLAFGVLVS